MLLVYGNTYELNERLGQMMRTTEDLITYAAKNKHSDPSAFVKKTFKPNVDVSEIARENSLLRLLVKSMNRIYAFKLTIISIQKLKRYAKTRHGLMLRLLLQ